MSIRGQTVMLDNRLERDTYLMQIVLTMDEYESLRDEVSELRKVVAVLAHRLGGDVRVQKGEALNLTYIITPVFDGQAPKFMGGKRVQRYKTSWHVQVEEDTPDE